MFVLRIVVSDHRDHNPKHRNEHEKIAPTGLLFLCSFLCTNSEHKDLNPKHKNEQEKISPTKLIFLCSFLCFGLW